MTHHARGRLSPWLMGGAVAALIATAAHGEERSYQIKAQDLGRALKEFGLQSGRPISFTQDRVRGLRSNAVMGVYDDETALRRLLQGANLTFVRAQNGFAVVRNDAPEVIKVAGQAAAAPSATPAQIRAEAAPEPVFVEEVVVTAQRRAETVQSVPLAVSAATGESLAKQGVKNIVDLSAQAPSLQISNGSGGNAQIFMRGVGSTNTTVVGDPAVAVHVDGIYVSRANAVSALFYDLDRVEVVRGPQGTLYGRNATAGAINIITNAPKHDYQGALDVEVGNYAALTTSGMVNVPLGEALAVRAAFQTSRHDGYLKAVNKGPGTGGNDRNDQDDTSYRLSALYQPNEKLKVLVRGDYLHRGGAGFVDVAYPLETGDPYSAKAKVNTSQDNTFKNITLEASYDFDWATLTYLAGHRDVDVNTVTENMASDNHRPTYQSQDNWSETQELRLGGGSGKLKWVTGLYSFMEKSATDTRILQANGNYLAFFQPYIFSRSAAAFGQATYSVTDQLRVTAGARYTRDHKGRSGNTYLLKPDFSILSLVVRNLSDETWNATNWKLGVDYDVNPTSMLYAQASTGYKAGGYFDGLPPNAYAPEHITAYEVGSKNRFFDRRLRLNVAGFYNAYRDLQVSAVENIAGQNALVTRNAGKAVIYGVEVESDFKITRADSVDLTLSWLHGRYDTFVLPLGDPFVNNALNATTTHCFKADYAQAAPRAGDFSGCHMARTPDWSVTVGYAHTFELANGANLTGRIQSHYESAKDLEFHGFTTNRQDAFTKTDLSVTYASQNGRWSLMAYVRNLEDEAVKTNSNSNATTGVSTNGTAFYAPPRLYGMRLSAKFN
ncbi:TonB-dependent receptor [Caulobacter sp. UNC279MFTsu5.1]|uniref:TonB-dependent receptor domain-containing protein n=1 Tax=Caulobacter sp. UNC279MFTsu5.1 TaxID=1502775 RepID=UPI0008F40A46|nr:TonB-dependent receptor [Caulobacter sp. UNC279MFTsu5.1]SFK56635.1 iron complex outermembrane recepter protein [Caulobacter sp. UNC279MFTsu5.1]